LAVAKAQSKVMRNELAERVKQVRSGFLSENRVVDGKFGGPNVMKPCLEIDGQK